MSNHATPQTTQPAFKLKEQVFGGTPYFYARRPMPTFVVRLDLAKPVDGETLQLAVADTLERMPYFADALAERDGDFYYAQNPLPFEVAEGTPRAVGGPATNWHNVDVTYEDAQLSLSMFHGFTDGLGLNHFIESVLYHYFCRSDGVTYPADGIRTQGSPRLPGEEADAHARPHDVTMTNELAATLAQLGTGGYPLPEAQGNMLAEELGVPLRVREDELVALARSCGSSPAPTLAALMADAVRTVHPDVEEDIGAAIPASARVQLGVPNTFKVHVTPSLLHVSAVDATTLSFAERAAKLRHDMRSQLVPDVARFLANKHYHDVIGLRGGEPGFAARQRTLNALANAQFGTFAIDYVGGLNLPGYEDKVRAVRYIAPLPEGAVRPPFLTVSATGGYFNLVLCRAFASDAYELALADQLRHHGIACDLLAPQTFTAPPNGLLSALGLA